MVGLALPPWLLKVLGLSAASAAKELGKAAAKKGHEALTQKEIEKALSEAIRAELSLDPTAPDKLKTALDRADRYGRPSQRASRAKDLLDDSLARKKAAPKASAKKAAKKKMAKKAVKKKAASKKMASKKRG